MAKLKVKYGSGEYEFLIDDETVAITFDDLVFNLAKSQPNVFMQILKGVDEGIISLRTDFKPTEFEIEVDLPASIYTELQKYIGL